MRAQTPTRAFRELLAADGLIVQPCVWDGLTAKIAESLGFPALALGGYAMGAHLGTSEPLLSLEDVGTCVRYVTMASSLPLMVDAGAGWGDPLHVSRTVKVLEHAGAASLHIEDQLFPKRAHYHKGIEHIISADEMVAKIKAAIGSRLDPDFVIVARSDALRTDDYDEAIRRSRAYHAAGADMIMLFPNDDEETKSIPRDLPGVPLVYVNSEGNFFERGVFSVEELESWGWKILYDAITLVNVTARAAFDVLTNLRDTGRTGLDNDEMIRVRKRVEDTLGLEEYYQLEQDTVETAGS